MCRSSAPVVGVVIAQQRRQRQKDDNDDNDDDDIGNDGNDDDNDDDDDNNNDNNNDNNDNNNNKCSGCTLVRMWNMKKNGPPVSSTLAIVLTVCFTPFSRMSSPTNGRVKITPSCTVKACEEDPRYCY